MRSLAFFLLVATTACSKPSSSGSSDEPDIPVADRVQASNIFDTRCVPCHGSTGSGDGPASASLNPKPRMFKDKSWQGSVTNEHIEKIIQYGGAAVGKSAAMPANPDLQAKPLVVKALVARIRAFGK